MEIVAFLFGVIFGGFITAQFLADGNLDLGDERGGYDGE